jgi:hypothetical protein
MQDNLERTLLVGMLQTFADTMNRLTLGFRHEQKEARKGETCVTAKLESGDAIWLWFYADDPSKIQMSSVPVGSSHGRFGYRIEGDKVEVGFFGRVTHLPGSSVQPAIDLVRRWRDLAIAAHGQPLIVFPVR